MKKNIALLYCLLLFSMLTFAQRGKDGARTVTSPNTIVNEYTTLIQNATVGDLSIKVANNSLDQNNLFISPLAPGDLILIYQAQGANVFSASDDSTWGAITAYNNCGFHQLIEVASISGSNSIGINCPLQYNFSVSGKTQVVRVPRYTTLNVNSGSVTCPPWDGNTGGIVAIETLGDINLLANTTINANAKGFRGGVPGSNNATYGVLNFTKNDNSFGGEKGEGIAGSQSAYDTIGGRYCKGAAANAGGGSSAHNAGGGGGSNVGNLLSYTGWGNPDVTNNNYIAAWNLERPNFATSTSSGGGKGGYSFSANDLNATVNGIFVIGWGGDLRRDNGGRGGRVLNPIGNRLFFGGGGGAGNQNDNTAGRGGAGGGLVYIYSYGSVLGQGSITSNGQVGTNSGQGFIQGADGAGGAGGGGTVYIKALNAIGGVSIVAQGGKGGDHLKLLGSDAYGPGGGGGGGYILTTTTNVTRNANGGENGLTTSPGMLEFPPNGATAGGAGLIVDTLTPLFNIVTLGDTACTGQQANLSASVIGNLPQGATLTWYDATVDGTVLGTGPTLQTTSPTAFVGICPGTFRVEAPIIGGLDPIAQFAWADSGDFVAYFINQSVNATTYQWLVNGIPTNAPGDSIDFNADGTYTVSLIASNPCGADTATQTVTVIKSSVNEDFTTVANIQPLANNDFQLTLNKPQNSSQLQVYSLNGSLVNSYTFTGTNLRFTTPQTGAFYIVRLITTDGSFAKKLPVIR